MITQEKELITNNVYFKKANKGICGMKKIYISGAFGLEISEKLLHEYISELMLRFRIEFEAKRKIINEAGYLNQIF